MRGRQLLQRSFSSIALGLFVCLGVASIIFIASCGGSGHTDGQTTTTVTSVTVTPSTKTITAGDNVSFAAAVAGQNNPSQAVTWSVSPTSAGTITANGAFTSSKTITAVTTATITANSTVPGYTNVSGSATVTIDLPVSTLPNSTSISPDTVFISWSNYLVVTATLTGSNYADTDTINPTGFNELQAWDVVNPNEIQLGLGFGGNDWSPGWLTFAICENSNDTNCGTSQSIAFMGWRNQCATSASGEIFCIDPTQDANSSTNGYVRKYKPDGTADGSFHSGPAGSIAVDNKTGVVSLDGETRDQNGNYSDVPGPDNVLPGYIVAVASEDGYSCFTQPSNNSASCYDLTAAPYGGVPVVNALKLGMQPEAIAMGTFGSETDAFVVSVNDTDSFHLHKVRASDAYAGEEPALALPGTTPAATVVAASITAGGEQVVVLDNGPASGTIAILSTYDQLLLFVDESTWTVTKSVKLSGTPFRIFADATNGSVIVAYANPESVTTTYASVDALSGTVTPLTSTSSLLSVGGVVSSDGTKLFLSMRDQMDIQPNK